MELHYSVRGADGKEYGPATLEQISEWIRQGRVPAKQEVRRSDMEYWVPAGDFEEFRPLYEAPQTAAAGGTAVAAPAQGAALRKSTLPASAQVKSSASWFYWIAGLSLVNSVAAFSGSGWRFILGLGVTQIFDSIAANMAGGGKVVALILDLLAAGFCILLGFFAQKGHLWAFIVGMILLALDGIVFFLQQDWLGVGFHAFVLFVLFRGVAAARAQKV